MTSGEILEKNIIQAIEQVDLSVPKNAAFREEALQFLKLLKNKLLTKDFNALGVNRKIKEISKLLSNFLYQLKHAPGQSDFFIIHEEIQKAFNFIPDLTEEEIIKNESIKVYNEVQRNEFIKKADEEREIANSMRRWSIFSMVFTTLISLAFIFIPIYLDVAHQKLYQRLAGIIGNRYEFFIIRIGVIGLLIFLSVYLSKESSKYRLFANKCRWNGYDVALLPQLINEMQDKDKSAVLANLSKKILGNAMMLGNRVKSDSGMDISNFIDLKNKD